MTRSTQKRYDDMACAEKAARLMLAVGEDNVARMFELMEKGEVAGIYRAMSQLGAVSTEVVDRLFSDSAQNFGDTGLISATDESPALLLIKTLGADRAAEIMESVRGPSGRTVLPKLAKVSVERLAGYLRAGHSQTGAVVLCRVEPETAAGVLARLPGGSMTRSGSVCTAWRFRGRRSSRTSSAPSSRSLWSARCDRSRAPRTPTWRILSARDGRSADRLLCGLEERAVGEAHRVRELMFTFEDLAGIDMAGMRRPLPEIDKQRLALALKSGGGPVREAFLSAMSERGRRIMREDIDALGAVRLRDAETARGEIVARARELSRTGAIALADKGMVA